MISLDNEVQISPQPLKYKKTDQKKGRSVDDPSVRSMQKIVDKGLVGRPVVDRNRVEGVAIKRISTRTSSTFLSEVGDYSDPNLSNRAETVALARKLRSVEGVCSSVIDLLVDFAVVDGSFFSDNEELKDLLNKWAKYVNSPVKDNIKRGTVFPVPGLREFARRIVDDILTDGDSVFSLFWSKGVKLEPDSEAAFLPVTMKALDTLSLSEDSELAKLGFERLTLKLSTGLIDKIKNPKTDADKVLKDVLPKEWLTSINNNEDIVLDPRVTYHLKRNGKDYKPWGESYLLKAFTAVSNKRRLQAVDASTIDGLINRVTIYSIGLQDKEKNPAYHIPSANRVNALIDMLTDPNRMNSIVWPGPDLSVQEVGPDAKILEFDKKYRQADIDIIRALHVSPLLIDGTGTSKDWVEFLSTEVGLSAVRNQLQQVFTLIAKEIAIANNMDFETLGYRYETLPLKEEATVKNFAIKMYEHGVLSIESFLKAMGYDLGVEKVLKQREKDEGLADLMVNLNIPGQTNINNVGQNDPGRPDNVEEIDKRSAAFISDPNTFYFENYLRLFDTMVANVKNALGVGDLELAESFVLSSFKQFNLSVDMELIQVFRKYAKRNDSDMINFLKAWNEKYITKFYNEVLDKLRSDSESFEAYIKSLNYRLYQYARESAIKAFWVAQIVRAKYRGHSQAVVLCKDDATCDLSKEPNKVYSLDYLIENFPTHPNCRCVLDFM